MNEKIHDLLMRIFSHSYTAMEIFNKTVDKIMEEEVEKDTKERD